LDEHIAETELSLYAFNPDALPLARQNAIDEHAAACADCRATLDFFMVTEEELRDPDVWERTAGSATLDSLRAHAERIAAEDHDAEALLARFFSSPALTAMTNLETLGKRYMTGGVVRRLSAHAHGICESEPLDALTFADAAVNMAETLPDHTYPAKAVFELRGTAWKERANSQLMLGELPGALESLTRAERAYGQLISPALGLATVDLVRAGVLYEQRLLDEAAKVAEQAERRFAHMGDEERRMKALHLRGSIKLEAGDLSGAIAFYQQVLQFGEASADAGWIARAEYAIGHCEVDRGNLAEATMRFRSALAIFRETGPPVDRIRTEWGLARVVLQGGKPADAIRRLRDVAAQYEHLGMVTDAALVGLDIADALLKTGQMQEIAVLAARLFHVFKDAATVTGALTAVAYLKEAATTGTLTSHGTHTVRTFLRRAERRPDLVFLPPPDDFR
jgi:tetratricopeptide (TPR) repeat protein